MITRITHVHPFFSVAKVKQITEINQTRKLHSIPRIQGEHDSTCFKAFDRADYGDYVRVDLCLRRLRPFDPNLSESPLLPAYPVFFLHASGTAIAVRQAYSFDGYPGAEACQPSSLENHPAGLARRRCLRELRSYQAIVQ